MVRYRHYDILDVDNMTEVFRSEASSAEGSFLGQALLASSSLTAALLFFSPLVTFDYSLFYGLGLLVVAVFFGVKADRNYIIVKRYIQHPPHYDEEKRHYDEEHHIP
jgi:hypothetical protein